MDKESKILFEKYQSIYEQVSNIEKYKDIIDKLSLGEFDTNSQVQKVDQGEKEGIFDVQIKNNKREVDLTNKAIEEIESKYPDLKDKFWECGKCKADYPGCGASKRKNSS